MNPTLILVANAARARILQQEGASRSLTLLHSIEHPASRSRSAELGGGEAGRGMRDGGFGGVAYEPRSDAQRKEQQHFADQLAAFLERSAQEQRYAAVHVFASSPFLGRLKHALGPATRRLQVGTHDVDLTTVGLAELPRRMESALA